MSHHINFNAAIAEQRHESPKLSKSKESSARRRENKKLEIDNKQMEWRLNQLKLAMEKEKEERGKQSYIWKSAHDGKLDSHARNILGRSVKSSNKPTQKLPKTKVKILTDEPLDIPKRKSHSKELIEKLKKPTPPKKKLSPGPSVTEIVNRECWVSVAMDRESDEVLELQSDKDGNMPLSSVHGINPTAIGLYYMQYGRKRLLLAIENKIMQPKAGWGTEVYFPYVANISPQKLKIEPTPPTSSHRKVTKDDLPEKSSTGGKLLNGSFNEEENAKAFQKALMEWRKGNVESPPGQRSVEMVVHDVQSEPVPVDVTFSETSTLTYMEKLLVKKHRESTVPPLPSSNIEKEPTDLDFDSGLTAKELEDHARFRDLFTPNPPDFSGRSSSSFGSEGTCRITEIIENSTGGYDASEIEQMQSETMCYVQEVEEDDSGEEDYNKSNGDGAYAQQVMELQQSYHIQHNANTESNNVGFKLEEVMQNNNSKEQVQVADTKSIDKQLSASCDTTNSPKTSINTNDGFSAEVTKISSFHEKSVDPLKRLSGLLQVVGDIPLNPDAVYQNDLTTFQSEIAAEQENLLSNLDQSHANIMMCSQGTSLWSISDSVDIPKVQDTKVDNSLLLQVQMEEKVERENEDAQAIDQLEWELASQTGNLTNDGRISRLIDEWSSDEDELGIVNDNGLGSGLSTPDHDPISLVGTSMSWQEDDETQHEFQKIENFMLADRVVKRRGLKLKQNTINNVKNF